MAKSILDTAKKIKKDEENKTEEVVEQPEQKDNEVKEEQPEQKLNLKKEEKEEPSNNTEENKSSKIEMKIDEYREKFLNLDEGKRKKIIGGSVIAFVLLVVISATSQTSNKTSNITKNILKTESIKKKSSISVEEGLTSNKAKENLLEKINKLEKEVKKQSNNRNNYTSNNVDLNKQKYKSYVELSKLLFKNKIILKDNSKVEVKFNSDSAEVIISSNGIPSTFKNTTGIPIEVGYIIDYPNEGITYVVVSNNGKINEETNMWQINPITKLKKIISIEEKKEILNIIKNNTNEDMIIKKYEKTFLMLGQNGEIVDELKYKSIDSKFQESKLGVVKESELVSGYMTKDFELYKVKDNLIRKNNNIYFPDTDATYKIKLAKIYNQENKKTKDYILIYKNDILLEYKTLSDIRNVYLKTYKDEISKKEYVEEDGVIFEVSEIGKKTKIGNGVIVAKIDNGIIKEKKITLEEKNMVRFPLSKLTNKNGKQISIYLITEDNKKLLVKNDFIYFSSVPKNIINYYLDNNGYLYEGDIKIKRIKKIENNKKVGVEIITENDYLINIVKKDTYSIFDLNNNKELYKGDKLKFKLLDKEGKIQVTKINKIIVDKKAKTINGVKYEKFEHTEGMYVLYNKYGEVTKTFKENNDKVIIDEKIKNLKVIDGSMFSFLYSIDTKTGEVNSNDIGKFFLKYDKDKNPYSEFNTDIIEKEYKSKKVKESELNIINVKDIYEKNYKIQKIKFITINGDEFKILGKRLVSFNGTKLKIEDNSVYNKKRKSFSIDYLKKENPYFYKKYAKKGYDKSLNIYIEKIINEESNYYVGDNYIFDYKQFRIIKTKEGFDKIIDENYDIIRNKIIIKTKSKTYTLNINDTVKMNEGLLSTLVDEYKELEKQEKELNVVKGKLNNDLKYKISLLKKQLKEVDEEIKNKSNVQLNEVKYSISKEMKKKIVKQNTIPDFTFEIGTKLKFQTNEGIAYPEGDKMKVMLKLKTTYVNDYYGNEIVFSEPKVVAEVSGDFSTGQMFLHPTKILYKDEAGERKVIEIPKNSTSFIYEDENGDKENGIPAYVVRKELKNLDKKVLISMIGGVVDNLTKPDDGFTDLLNGGTTDTKSDGQMVTESVATGTNEGLQEIKDTINKLNEKEKDVLIVSPKLDFEVIFTDSVDIYFDKK